MFLEELKIPSVLCAVCLVPVFSTCTFVTVFHFLGNRQIKKNESDNCAEFFRAQYAQSCASALLAVCVKKALKIFLYFWTERNFFSEKAFPVPPSTSHLTLTLSGRRRRRPPRDFFFHSASLFMAGGKGKVSSSSSSSSSPLRHNLSQISREEREEERERQTHKKGERATFLDVCLVRDPTNSKAAIKTLAQKVFSDSTEMPGEKTRKECFHFCRLRSAIIQIVVKIPT